MLYKLDRLVFYEIVKNALLSTIKRGWDYKLPTIYGIHGILEFWNFGIMAVFEILELENIWSSVIGLDF